MNTRKLSRKEMLEVTRKESDTKKPEGRYSIAYAEFCLAMEEEVGTAWDDDELDGACIGIDVGLNHIRKTLSIIRSRSIVSQALLDRIAEMLGYMMHEDFRDDDEDDDDIDDEDYVNEFCRYEDDD